MCNSLRSFQVENRGSLPPSSAFPAWPCGRRRESLFFFLHSKELHEHFADFLAAVRHGFEKCFLVHAVLAGAVCGAVPDIDQLGHHKLIYVFGLVVAISAWLIIVTIGVNGPVGLWAFAILWGVQGGTSVQIFYALWGSELFPAKFRAGAQGLMFFIVRGLSAVWGLLFTYIYGEQGEGFTLAAYCMIALLAVSLIVGILGAPKTRGRSLEDITKERYGEDY